MKRHTLILSIGMLLLGVGACSSDDPPDGLAAANAPPPAAAESRAPAALRAAYIASVQRAAPPAYAATANGRGGLTARNEAHRFVAGFDGRRVSVTPEGDGAWHLGLGVARYGCGERLSPVAGARVEQAGNRVAYKWEGAPVEEWYLNGALGLEQGFTVAAPPCAGDGTIAIEMALEGLTATPEGEGAATLRDDKGAAVLRYADVFAKDAEGRALPARLSVEGARLSLRVDAAGAAYPVEIDPLIAPQVVQILDSGDMTQDPYLVSTAISADGTTAIVADAWYGVGTNTKQGKAYIFVKSGTTWTEAVQLTASDGAENDQFGTSVAISADGSTAVVGAPNSQGEAYVFVKSGATWIEGATLTASDHMGGEAFGVSVGISADGSTTVVGAFGGYVGGVPTGAAYVFTGSGATWTEAAKLSASDGEHGDAFGASVAITSDGSTMVVGSPKCYVGGVRMGAAYVFAQSGATWTEAAKLSASDGADLDYFGYSVAITPDGSTAAFGTPYDDAQQGSVYMFVNNGATWTEAAKLTAAGGAAGDVFGLSVAISADGSTALVGAPYNNSFQGAAYVFVKNGATWTEEANFTDSNAFLTGGGVALTADGGTALVGTILGDFSVGIFQDTAYVLSLTTPLQSNGAACTAGSECGSGFCVDGVCCDTACGGGAGGDCQACSVAAGAAVDGTCGPSTGNACDDGDACTQTDACQSGTCTGTNPVTCAPLDACHVAGTCSPATGQCTNPVAPDGTACSDGHTCSTNDTCQSGACTAGPLDTTGPCTPVCLSIQRGTSGAVEDALLNSASPTKNYGASGSLTAGAQSGNERQALLWFDLSAVPSDAFVISADATLAVCLAGGAPVDAHLITSPWSEATVTWNSFGGAYAPAPVATFPSASAPSSTSASLLASVQAWVNGSTPNHGIALTRDLTAMTVFCPSEDPVATQRPKLDVCYVPGF